MTKKEIKAAFREAKVQLGAESLRLIEDSINRSVRDMARRCKEGNVKRLTPDLFWIALGKWNDR